MKKTYSTIPWGIFDQFVDHIIRDRQAENPGDSRDASLYGYLNERLFYYDFEKAFSPIQSNNLQLF